MALFFFRNWFYLTGSRLDSFSYPEVTVSWVLHQDMLLHEGAGKLTKNEKLLLRLIGLRLDGIPEDSERMLRDTITHLDKPQRNRAAVDELRAQLAS